MLGASVDLPAVDRVVSEHYSQLASSAQDKARQHWETAQEQTKLRLEAEAELEMERDANKKLRDELVRIKQRHREEQRAASQLLHKVKDLQSEVERLTKERDHWHHGCQRAATARDAAVGAACALRDALRDAPGHESGETAALLRAQLIACRSRKNEHKQRANQLQNRADSEHLRVEALEREVAVLQEAAAAAAVAAAPAD